MSQVSAERSAIAPASQDNKELVELHTVGHQAAVDERQADGLGTGKDRPLRSRAGPLSLSSLGKWPRWPAPELAACPPGGLSGDPAEPRQLLRGLHRLDNS